MPIPKAVARLNRVGLNRVTRHIAPRAPGFGVVVHTGRRSGRRYETPVNVFPIDGGLRIALTYGTDADWVRNVLAAGGCTVRTRGREVTLTGPHLVHDDARTGVGHPARDVLAVIGVADFLDLTVAPGS